MIQTVSDNCEICRRYRTPSPRPVVGFSTASIFNETVAMDLKFMDGHILLHTIDHATRFSAACVINNKRKETIMKAIMEIWIRIFGPPSNLLTDN